MKSNAKKVAVVFCIIIICFTLLSRVANNALKSEVTYTSKQVMQLSSEGETQEYKNVIPLDAVRQVSDNEFYLLYIEEEKSVLGNELVAKKMNITILKKTQEYVAVEETIGADMKIIVTSSKAIGEGYRVKVNE